ncbi:MAG: hypothetical protein IJH75_06055 [Mogibacterium sp.]|nr:hypothetical protein [Mogibacterium sp.]
MTKIQCPGRNHLLINRRPGLFGAVTFGGRGLILTDEAGRVPDNGIIVMDGSVYVCLYCDAVRNITLLIDRPGQYRITTLLFAQEESYRAVLAGMRAAWPELRFSEQNLKINRYAERVLEKLREGTRLEIRDAVREEDVVYCPECGVQCEPGMAYCMECGAELPVR